jgi:pimeloyl-ACP methyl ester carboxylesterase
MSSKSSSWSVRKSAISTISAVIITAVLIGSIVGGAGYVYSTQTDAIVSELKSESGKLGSQVRTVQDESAKLNSQVKIVTDDNNRLKSLSDNLNSKIKTSDEDNSRLRSQINDLNGKISDANEKIAALSKSAVASFEFIPQPENIKLTMPTGAKVRFLRFTDVDGFNSNGALWEPQDRKPTVAILLIHGNAANYTITFGSIPGVLASKGYAVLSINTRAHDGDAFRDNFDDNQKSLAAGVGILKSLGYNSVVLLGYSLGAEHVLAYEAFARNPAVKAIVIGGATANLPWLIRWWSESQNPGLYDRLYSLAKDYVAQGKSNNMLPERMPTPFGPVSLTAMNFMSYYSPESSSVSTTNIRRINVPVLIIRNQADSWFQSFEPQWIIGNATAPGSQVPSVKFIQLPDPSSPSRAGHQVRNFQDPFLNSVLSWLEEIRLR